MIWKILECLLLGFTAGLRAVLSVLPFYEQLSGLEEQLIAWAVGVPVIFVVLIRLTPKIVKIGKNLFS